MGIFWLVIGLLTLIAVLFIVYPLLRTPQTEQVSIDELNVKLFKERIVELDEQLAAAQITESQYQVSKQELELVLLQDVSNEPGSQSKATRSPYLAVFLFLLVPTVAIWLYLQWGFSKPLAEEIFLKTHATQINALRTELKTPQKVITRMKKVLAKHPDSARGWYLLGKLYGGIRDYPQAVAAFAKAHQLAPKNTAMMLNYAEALFFENKRRLSPKAQKLIAQVIKREPSNVNAINLLAVSAYRNGRYQEAVNHWEKILTQFSPTSESGKVILAMIAKAQQHLSIAKPEKKP